MLHAGERIAIFVHLWQARNLFDTQAVDHNMHMDIAAFVVTVRVCAYQSLMAGKVLFAKIQSQLLCPIHRESVILRIAWIEADDIMMALDVST